MAPSSVAISADPLPSAVITTGAPGSFAESGMRSLWRLERSGG